jgi:hypothetical protein
VYEDWKEIVGSTHGMWFVFIGIQEELQTFSIISACAATIHLLFLSVVILVCSDFIHWQVAAHLFPTLCLLGSVEQ